MTHSEREIRRSRCAFTSKAIGWDRVEQARCCHSFIYGVLLVGLCCLHKHLFVFYLPFGTFSNEWSHL